MPRIFINLEAGCLQVNLMSTSTQINQLKYTILYYTIYTFKRLKLTSLVTRRVRGDLSEVFKLIEGFENVDSNFFFKDCFFH